MARTGALASGAAAPSATPASVRRELLLTGRCPPAGLTRPEPESAVVVREVRHQRSTRPARRSPGDAGAGSGPATRLPEPAPSQGALRRWGGEAIQDRKSTRLNSSHQIIS